MPIIGSNNIRSMFCLNVTSKRLDKFESLENIKSIRNLTAKELRQQKETFGLLSKYKGYNKEKLEHISRLKANFSSSYGRDKKNISKSPLTIEIVNNSSKDAKEMWLRDPKRNNFRTVEISRKPSDDISTVIQGELTPLIGKGIIGNNGSCDRLPFSISHVQNDAKRQEVCEESATSKPGLVYFTGKNITSAEMLPGSPIGQYYHQTQFEDNLNVLEIDNGDKGTFGISFDLNNVKEGEPLLIHAGALSGCSVVFATKANKLFALHAGQHENEKTVWVTGEKGAESIAKSVELLTSEDPSNIQCANNQELVSYLSSKFDQSVLVYRDDRPLTSEHNVKCFNYDSTTENKDPRVGNALALVSKKQGKINVQVLGDDMAVDKNSFETRSLSSAVFSLTPKLDPQCSVTTYL
ncbi:MAG: cytotoxic necrotizing factor Rho-activating domain-containing protein [Vibrio anguillarum]|uniref:cytotoxic necrotizing factor Rho-activating domain-containing protein n=3 Tax=Vibrio anguillarum TaxID=55601 RepID=UPI00169DBA9E|nr:cytotoxic necrotizing factor Rho-activating domain-containing protein [Vibrio anguillarum]MDT3848282.1 cytotoxic necrotizing factor Rho-activating domain-containing protein [Vibrio anguillarum]NOI07056.1 cytotoxic necrotizing factor [Vibrio anguillarum]